METDYSDKMKQDFFIRTIYEMQGEKARWKLYRNATCIFEKILEATALKTAAAHPLTSHLTNHWSRMNKTYETLLMK